MIDLNLNPSKKELRTFSLLLVPFLAFIGWTVARKSGSSTAGYVIGLAGLVLGLTGFAIPKIIRPIFIGSTVVSFPIGWVVSHILMAMIFYLVVTPVGVIMRLSGRDPMERSFDHSAKTYWKPRRTDSNSQRYFRQF